uniref:Uncharacterized protein n=1 Tax=Panagrolaimus davidi TaxID=227884 RepID=A0A914Q2U2_9BILA
MNVVSYLLDEDHGDVKINVNDADNEGNTLLSLVLVNEAITGEGKTLLPQIEYLTEKGANASIPNATGQTPFHYFVSKPTILRTTKFFFEYETPANESRLSKEEYLKAVDMLTGDRKAEIANTLDDDGNTIVEEALKHGNFLLAEKIFDCNQNDAIERWAKAMENEENVESNILHRINEAISVFLCTHSHNFATSSK